MKPLRRFSRLLAAGAATGAMMLALSAVAPGAARAADLAKVRFVFDWPTADFELVPLAVGQAEGLYKDAGLDVSVAFPPDSSTTARMLASGAGDVGFDATTDIIFAAQQGVRVAMADTDGDGKLDLLTAEGNEVQIRNPLTNANKKTMTPFDPAILGGVFVG